MARIQEALATAAGFEALVLQSQVGANAVGVTPLAPGVAWPCRWRAWQAARRLAPLGALPHAVHSAGERRRASASAQPPAGGDTSTPWRCDAPRCYPSRLGGGTLTTMDARHAIHELVDDLPESALDAAKQHLEYLRALERIPLDDEPSSPEEDADAREGWEEYKRGDFITAEDLKRELFG